MSFKEGFEAIAQIKSAGRTLGDSVEKIEALAQDLENLRLVQAGVETMLDQAKATFASLATSSEGLSEEREQFKKLAQTLPILTDNVLVQAEERLQTQQAEISRLAKQMPLLVEKVVEEKLSTIAMHMEGRLSNLLRDELKDTRAAMRDAFEVSARAQDKKLDDARNEILAEMPRTLFGRRRR